MFPDQLLSSHFWSEQQKNDLMARTLRKRHNSILKITKIPQPQNIIDVLHPAITAFQSEVYVACAVGLHIRDTLGPGILCFI